MMTTAARIYCGPAADQIWKLIIESALTC